ANALHKQILRILSHLYYRFLSLACSGCICKRPTQQPTRAPSKPCRAHSMKLSGKRPVATCSSAFQSFSFILGKPLPSHIKGVLMLKLQRLIISSLSTLLFFLPSLAQSERPTGNATSSAPVVTATASAKRVRFVAPSSVIQLRLEVYNQTGQKIFDTEQHGGNVLDWLVQDGQGERLTLGSYACVLTIKSLSGRFSQRTGTVLVADQAITVQPIEATELSTAQQQAVGPTEPN